MVLYLVGIALELSGVASTTTEWPNRSSQIYRTYKAYLPKSWTSLPPLNVPSPPPILPPSSFSRSYSCRTTHDALWRLPSDGLVSPTRWPNQRTLYNAAPTPSNGYVPICVSCFCYGGYSTRSLLYSDPPRPPPCRTNVRHCHPSIYCSGTSLQQSGHYAP